MRYLLNIENGEAKLTPIKGDVIERELPRLKQSSRDITQIVIHCTATKANNNIDMAEVKRWHLNKGWSDIGYHYFINVNGDLEIGRNVDRIGAHVRGHNKNSIGIVYSGGASDEMEWIDTRTDNQKRTMLKLLKTLRMMYPNAEILGHNNFKGVKKACPCFNAKKQYANI